MTPSSLDSAEVPRDVREPKADQPSPSPSALLRAGESLPARCDVDRLAVIFGRFIKTVDGWDMDGKLRRFEVRRAIGARRWSGRLLQPLVDDAGISHAVVRHA